MTNPIENTDIDSLDKQVTIPGESESLMTFELPPVSEQSDDFIESDEPEEQPAEDFTKGPDDYRGTFDEKGKEYDPSIHAYPPKITPGGRWSRASKRGAKTEKPNAAFSHAAQQYAMLYGNAHVSLFGADGSIDKENLVPLVEAVEAYMIENGISELDPKWQVLLAAGNYSTVICTREANAAKMRRWFSPVWNGFKSLFGFKAKKAEVIEIAETPEVSKSAPHSDGF